MKRIVRYFLYTLLQLTWGLLPTLAGFIVFLLHIRCPHSYYHGAVRTHWKHDYTGLSLGLFIFTPDDRHGRCPDWCRSHESFAEHVSEMSVHEYGHTLQALILGPLYVVVGLFSVPWAALPYFDRYRARKHVRYTDMWAEKWANRLGERVLRLPAFWS